MTSIFVGQNKTTTTTTPKVVQARTMAIENKAAVAKALLEARKLIQGAHGLADSETAKEMATIARMLDKTFRTVLA